eukprot:2089145-Rhodomonas_salina.5
MKTSSPSLPMKPRYLALPSPTQPYTALPRKDHEKVLTFASKNTKVPALAANSTTLPSPTSPYLALPRNDHEKVLTFAPNSTKVLAFDANSTALPRPTWPYLEMTMERSSPSLPIAQPYLALPRNDHEKVLAFAANNTRYLALPSPAT